MRTKKNKYQQILLLFIGKRDVVCSILSYKPSEQHFDEEPGITGTLNRNRANTTTTTTATTASSIPVTQQETRKL